LCEAAPRERQYEMTPVAIPLLGGAFRRFSNPLAWPRQVSR
jgi:hypothetical protein